MQIARKRQEVMKIGIKVAQKAMRIAGNIENMR